MIEVGVMPYKQYFKAGWREDARAREQFSSFPLFAAVLTMWPVSLIVQKASSVRPLLRKKKCWYIHPRMKGDIANYFKPLIVPREKAENTKDGPIPYLPHFPHGACSLD